MECATVKEFDFWWRRSIWVSLYYEQIEQRRMEIAQLPPQKRLRALLFSHERFAYNSSSHRLCWSTTPLSRTLVWILESPTFIHECIFSIFQIGYENDFFSYVRKKRATSQLAQAKNTLNSAFTSTARCILLYPSNIALAWFFCFWC